MAFNELKNLAKEAYLKRKIEELRNVYRSVQYQLAAQLRSIDLTDFQRARAEQILAEVKSLVGALNRKTYAWSKQSLPAAYEQGIDLAAERLRDLGVTRFVNYDAQIHTSAVSVLIDEVAVELITANSGIEKFFNRFIRQTQQRLLEDAEISKRIAEGVVQGQTRRTISDTLLQDMRAKMGREQFIVINGRNYRPDTYAEMIARTRTREATSQGTVNTALRYGVDLVQWDVHAEICEYCQQYAGRVYSLSGTDTDFPMLKEKPPLHPNCKCVVVPVTKGHLVRKDSLQELIKLSNSPLVEVDSFDRLQEVLNTI